MTETSIPLQSSSNDPIRLDNQEIISAVSQPDNESKLSRQSIQSTQSSCNESKIQTHDRQSQPDNESKQSRQSLKCNESKIPKYTRHSQPDNECRQSVQSLQTCSNDSKIPTPSKHSSAVLLGSKRHFSSGVGLGNTNPTESRSRVLIRTVPEHNNRANDVRQSLPNYLKLQVITSRESSWEEILNK